MRGYKQYIVYDLNFDKREKLCNYLEEHNYRFLDGDRSYYVNSKYPFVISKSEVWICSSITCCAAAAGAGIIISIDEFLKER